jgi:UDP-2-acetamido-2,6-beta-L-arabino-hexul-4-ose reductase
MNILITGANGFIGKNLIADLKRYEEHKLFKYDINNTLEELTEFIKQSDFIIHLAGVNRPKDDSEFNTGNKGLTEKIINVMKDNNINIPLLITSSIQADKDNAYGLSKKAAEEVVFSWAKETNNKAYVFRLPNVFGKWCRPNYNSVVATFMHNIANNLPIQINDENHELNLVYIDDIITEFKLAFEENPHINEQGYAYVPITYKIKLSQLADTVYSFKKIREDLSIPNMSDELIKKLYSTYLSYLSDTNLSYPLKMNIDNRGSFTEFIRTEQRGQISVNISKPGIVKGNHWHHTKNEKFLVISGQGVIRLRNINDTKILSFNVNGEKLEVIDIPVGYTHNIENTGSIDLVTVMWVNECFDSNNPDTYFEEV